MSENMRTYETICLTKVDMPEDKFNGMVEKIKSAVTKEGQGEVLMHDDWGKAKIAYPIDREPRAQWTYFRYSATPKAVESIGHQLRINEFVLRQLTCKCPADGSDYSTLRANMAKEVADRFNRFDDRPRRNKGPRRDMKGRGYGEERGERSYGEDSPMEDEGSGSGSESEGEN